MTTVRENAIKAVKARWAKTSKPKRYELSMKMHEAKRLKKLLTVKSLRTSK